MQTTRVDGVPHVKQSDVVKNFQKSKTLLKVAKIVQGIVVVGHLILLGGSENPGFGLKASGIGATILFGILFPINLDVVSIESNVPSLSQERIELI